MTEAEAALDAEAEAAEDVAGTGEEDTEAGMRQNAMERETRPMPTMMGSSTCPSLCSSCATARRASSPTRSSRSASTRYKDHGMVLPLYESERMVGVHERILT